MQACDAASLTESTAKAGNDSRLSFSGDYGTLRTWLDGSRHPATNEPTLSIEAVYVDQHTGHPQHYHQRGLRAPTVAGICACICFGEDNVSGELIEHINTKFRLLSD